MPRYTAKVYPCMPGEVTDEREPVHIADDHRDAGDAVYCAGDLIDNDDGLRLGNGPLTVVVTQDAPAAPDEPTEQEAPDDGS